jgi:hypothetical protein
MGPKTSVNFVHYSYELSITVIKQVWLYILVSLDGMLTSRLTTSTYCNLFIRYVAKYWIVYLRSTSTSCQGLSTLWSVIRLLDLESIIAKFVDLFSLLMLKVCNRNNAISMKCPSLLEKRENYVLTNFKTSLVGSLSLTWSNKRLSCVVFYSEIEEF